MQFDCSKCVDTGNNIYSNHTLNMALVIPLKHSEFSRILFTMIFIWALYLQTLSGLMVWLKGVTVIVYTMHCRLASWNFTGFEAVT